MGTSGTGRHCLVPFPAAATAQPWPEAASRARVRRHRAQRRRGGHGCVWNLSGIASLARRGVCDHETRQPGCLPQRRPVFRYEVRLQASCRTALERGLLRGARPCALRAAPEARQSPCVDDAGSPGRFQSRELRFLNAKSHESPHGPRRYSPRLNWHTAHGNIRH